LILLVFVVEAVLVEGVGELCLRRLVPRVLGWMKWLFLRTLLLLCGIWVIDEQFDGLTKAQRKLAVAPRAGDIVASNYTSPLDVIYLAAKYDPVFVSSFVTTDKVQPTSFLTALWRSLQPPLISPSTKAKLLTLQEVCKAYSKRIVAIFPEVTHVFPP